MSKIVIALGGNALGKNNTEQKEAVANAAISIVDLIAQGHQLIITHGNGPQVGMINNSFLLSFKNGDISEPMPFAECGSMSQGYIGYHIQNAIQNEVSKRNLKCDVSSLITQTLVDEASDAFKNPTKPIGSFMEKVEAKELAKKNNWIVKEDSGRGWRRVVPSPKPTGFVEENTIKYLFDRPNSLLIASGGGGIPVIKKNNKLIGVDSVIDKDFSAARMAQVVKADVLIILTAVDKIILNFGKENETPIDEITSSELQKLVDNNEFPEGSMKPKVQAILDFVTSTGNAGYIADLKLTSGIFTGESGTKIIKG